MKKFRFHMEKLLSYKSRILDSEIMNLAILNNMLDEAIKTRESLENEEVRHKLEFRNKISDKASPVDCRMYAAYAKHIKDQIEMCADEIKEIRYRAEKQAEKVKNLKVETKSLETIKDSRFAEYQKESLKKAEIFIDEFISGREIINQRSQLKGGDR